MLSYQNRSLPQESQKERPLTNPILRGILYETADIKDPTSNPKKNMQICSNKNILLRDTYILRG